MADETLSTAPVVKERVSSHPGPIIAKIAEVILAVFIIGLMVDPLNSYQKIPNRNRRKLDDVAIIYISVAGYLLINMLFIIGYVLGDRMPRKTAVMFSAMGSLLHIVAGSVMVHSWRSAMGSYMTFDNNATHSSKQYNDMLISGAVFTFVNAIVFAVDVFVTIKYT